ncbi:serine hydrolase domain-containing protein [Aureivirga marina]|uniref:serine hydrolase domain-containing protein n=1 Tax=Aureivirga marina TaxID=1182451 RepID=UPI0018CA5401|nr:serine hydrolase domain-containing protein [Aureivirga marina]
MAKNKKKRIFQFLLIIGTVISLFYVPWILVYAWILPLPNSIQEEVNKAVDHGFDATIVYIDEAGKSPTFYASGWHDPKQKIPANPHALFKIASISKLYVAVAITKLANDKKIDLQKTVADYFPELKGKIENIDKITIKMLVQHRSGIPNFTNYPNYWANPKETSKEKLALIYNLPANFAPDESYEYSNTNYLLLRDLMNKTLGYSFHQYIKEEILIPLNLKNTFASLDEIENLDKIVSGYHVGYDVDLKTDKQGMIATAQDVATFLRALNNGSLFKNGEKEIYDELYIYNHTGLIPGYQSIAKYHKDLDAVVIQFTSPTDFKGFNWNLSEIIYNRIVKILRKKKD